MATDIKQSDSSKPSKKLAFQPKSQHTSDEFLQDFLNPSFDPISYINANLPPLAQKSPVPTSNPNAVPLAELATQSQTLLTQLDAHTTRLSDTLTRITDDILRSGSRMSYEVEMLRGEALSLEELLFEKLAEEIKLFVPGGLKKEGEAKEEGEKKQQVEEEKQKEREDSVAEGGKEAEAKVASKAEAGAGSGAVGEEPDSIKQLRTLTLVRERLDSVIKTFGDAMEFTFPPSEVSVSSGFLSVSAPEPGSELQSSEERGQQVLKKLREEISSLLNNKDDPVSGIEKAAERIEKLKELTTVWTGTAEEKGRMKFIESLAKMVEDRHRELLKEMDVKKGEVILVRGEANAGVSAREAVAGEKALPAGFGLMSQLQKLRGGL
ncbi:hypothetical protein TGAM01_v210190 [Trichoderma gamsii]|uniref:Uncharacterized protein n=1 Tax=Trichoderma gamsii TaxID=398673 RepID=A0A2P4Z9F2_9HYPO|nr:hypothetical protein TGAM01_v210190 [Trichoderma gamsii]PON20905.1 hypothetical protein TGAM01_v210190 [Trichoderma gamsii]